MGGVVVGAMSATVCLGAAPGAATAAPPVPTRVELQKPSFSNPTRMTNPLFPKDRRTQVIQLGDEGDVRLRFEVTQLRRTKVVRWDGKEIRTVVTHFMAYDNGRLVEVALDYYAQADDGPSGTSARTSTTTRTVSSPTTMAPGSPAGTGRPG